MGKGGDGFAGAGVGGPAEVDAAGFAGGLGDGGGAAFGGGLFGGLAAGFLGAGLFGLLFGHGLFSGMAGFASVIGLLLQVVLVVIVGRLIFAWWQRRNMSTPAYARAHPASAHNFGGLSGISGGANAALAGEHLTIAKSDYDAFERLLGEIQFAYSTEDLSALRARVTPEMLSHFSEQLATNASRGLINRVTEVKLLQGDLAEAWHEGDKTDYATVAMKFALKDSLSARADRPSKAASRARSPNCGPSCVRVVVIGYFRPSSRLNALCSGKWKGGALLTALVGNHCVVRQIHSDHVITRLRQSSLIVANIGHLLAEGRCQIYLMILLLHENLPDLFSHRKLA